MVDDTIRFYFSFRSPYSCLGLFRFYHFLPKLGVQYQLIPLVPPKEFTEKPIAAPDKLQYIITDVARIFKAYGLPIKMPDPFDVDWGIPHTAFVYADQQNKGLKFAYQAYMARYCEGKNLAEESALIEIAVKCELDPDALLSALTQRKFQKELLRSRRTMTEDAIFGVPTFVYHDDKYWGNDRFDWLVRQVYQDQGKTVTDLSIDPMSKVF